MWALLLIHIDIYLCELKDWCYYICMKITHTHITALITGLIIGSLAVLSFINLHPVTDNERVLEYYKVENSVAVSPYDIKSGLQKNTQDSFILVDLRTQPEYEKEHITSAINIPNYLDPAISGQDNSSRIIAAFAELHSKNPNKDIIMYCYSAACTASRKVGLLLAEHGITAKHLNIGWYEWKYYWNMWNGEDGLKAEDFITTGKDPGTPNLKNTIISPCGADNEFGC